MTGLNGFSDSRRRIFPVLGLVFLASASLDRAWAQTTTQNPEEKKLGWTNARDFSLVVTAGNSAAQTLGYSDHLRYTWPEARFSFDATGVQSDTSDDRYFVVPAGQQFPVGGKPPNVTPTLVKPEPTSDVPNYLIGGRYDKDITKRFFWNAGASWDHNKDAGIVSRYIAFAGIGNNCVDTARRRFLTDYGISYTDRKEEEPDPEKERRFGGLRLGWSYTEHFNQSTTLDVVAFVDVVNPDGVPGSGDEFFRTQPSGGVKLVVGTADAGTSWIRSSGLRSLFRSDLAGQLVTDPSSA